MFEKVIQEVCDASQVDFEESGVDQQTLHDLREVSSRIPYLFLGFVTRIGADDLGGSRKSGEVRGGAGGGAYGGTPTYESSFICAAVTRLGAFRPPRFGRITLD